ncbi:LD-carboxypeptidase [Sphingomonas rhizophila]|uniref:LD-carboxypeptidase n=1 Tax=Sphingomonas rhizophila TaxID=2071607 RepID=A0A7G9S8M3_9SPHN|nr:LD-carboxypeptidase [Sphingomonas rhizophila]QNN64198.1 LD-carboxypeptidase [Sphingomonas rhizophila]
MKIAVVAPSCTLSPKAADAVQAIVAQRGDCELAIHPQCFLSTGHFAGPDEARLAAIREVMADDSVDAVWFARGGYGSNRIAEAAGRDLPDAARRKTYMGYSDAGFLLAAFHRAGLSVAHGPMVQDILRQGGEAAVGRALDWLVRRDAASLEPGLQPGQGAMAFNLTVLSSLLGTPIEPDFSGRELLIEEVAEHEYRIDRMMFHLVNSPAIRACRSLRMGRMSEVPDNDPVFGSDAAAIVVDWCARSGIAFAGTADIGHDSANRVVPFSPVGD